MAGTSPTATLIGQLTDTHVVSRDPSAQLYVDNNERLRLAVESIRSESPPLDALVITGDLVNDASSDEYGVLAELLAPLDMPVIPLPGNHDDRSMLAATFPDIGWASPTNLSWVRTFGDVRIIGLDSTRPGQHGGEFDDERSEWLDAQLAQDHDGVTLLALHHPPFATGIEWMDRDGFLGADRLADRVAGSSISRILCGHVHRPVTSMVGGVVAQVAMSTVQHVALDLSEVSSPSLIKDPVGYQVHRFVGGISVTHARYIDTGQDAFVPDWADEY